MWAPLLPQSITKHVCLAMIYNVVIFHFVTIYKTTVKKYLHLALVCYKFNCQETLLHWILSVV